MFSNRTVNLLNLHLALWNFGYRIVILFGPIYLLKLGLSLPKVALIWGAVNIVRFALRPLSFWWTQKLGLKKALILGALITVGIFPILYMVKGAGFWLWVLIFYFGLTDVAYWLPFHAYYSIAGNLDRRGKQNAVRGALMLIGGSAPIVGGFIVAIFGFSALYGFGIMAVLLSIWPLFYAADISGNERMSLSRALKTIDPRGFGVAVGDAILTQSDVFLWTISIYYLTTNLVDFGWIIGLQILVGSILYLILGTMIDRGKGKKLFLVGSLGLATALLGRAYSVHNVTDIVISQILFALLSVFYSGPMGAGCYNMAKQTKSTLWFYFFGEAGYDLGALILLFVSALLIHFGFKAQHLLPLGIVGIIIVKWILDSYYNERKKHGH